MVVKNTHTFKTKMTVIDHRGLKRDLKHACKPFMLPKKSVVQLPFLLI